MAYNEEWSSSDDEAPEEQSVSVSKKVQLKQKEEQHRILKEQRTKEKEQRRNIQQRRELEKIEREKKKLIEIVEEEEEQIPDELPMELLENVEQIKPTKVIFNQEEQKLEKVLNLKDIKQAKLKNLRALRTNIKKVDGGIKVQKIIKNSLKSRKLDTGLQNFKTNWLNRKSVNRS